jgi:predicted deacylase
MKFFKYFILTLFLLVSFLSFSQEIVPIIKNLSEINNKQIGVQNYWLEMGTNTYNFPILIPVVVIQGSSNGPTLGLTAAIHGDELNGIPIIHELISSIDAKRLIGRIIAIPGVNAYSIQNDQRRFIDDEDLNRIFPGKIDGDRSQQYAYKINERVLPSFSIHIDMHTASFGRVNSMYARVDSSNDTLRILAKLQQPDIILNSKGASTLGANTSSTMREEATAKGMQSITIEYGNPQVFQGEMTDRGVKGVLNTLAWLNMYGTIDIDKFEDNAIYCKKSYWIYMEEGGFLEVTVALKQHLQKGDKIAIVRNAFGSIIKEYFAPEGGVVIGKSTNPANMSGGRIIHLGIEQ